MHKMPRAHKNFSTHREQLYVVANAHKRHKAQDDLVDTSGKLLFLILQVIFDHSAKFQQPKAATVESFDWLGLLYLLFTIKEIPMRHTQWSLIFLCQSQDDGGCKKDEYDKFIKISWDHTEVLKLFFSLSLTFIWIYIK